MVQASLMMIVIYSHHIFIVQATGKLLFSLSTVDKMFGRRNNASPKIYVWKKWTILKKDWIAQNVTNFLTSAFEDH